ncbi:MAG: hypothetical protein IKQ94_04970 [Bacteroidales bacterium]|nr:hypothetical protein [Bacteroidales bacterium]
MQGFDFTGLIISIIVVGVVLLAAYFFKKRSSEHVKDGDTSQNKGCSIAFYIFLALLLVGLIVAYIFYRWHS